MDAVDRLPVCRSDSAGPVLLHLHLHHRGSRRGRRPSQVHNIHRYRAGAGLFGPSEPEHYFFALSSRSRRDFLD